MVFVYCNQNSISTIGAYCWGDIDKARERKRERLVSIEGNKKKEKPGRVTPCVRQNPWL